MPPTRHWRAYGDGRCRPAWRPSTSAAGSIPVVVPTDHLRPAYGKRAKGRNGASHAISCRGVSLGCPAVALGVPIGRFRSSVLGYLGGRSVVAGVALAGRVSFEVTTKSVSRLPQLAHWNRSSRNGTDDNCTRQRRTRGIVVGHGAYPHAPAMFVVTDAEATAIRDAFHQRCTRLRSSCGDRQPAECARNIVGWKPLPMHTVKRAPRLRRVR